jgi:Ca2+-binding RTX toxin-like protein
VVARLRTPVRHLALATGWAVAVLALAPSLAAGATLRYEVVRDVLAIGLTAQPGEANRVTVSRDDQSLVFADRIQAALRLVPPTTSCRTVGSPQELRCSAAPGGNLITLDLQDRDDVAAMTAAEPTIFEGGTGDDSLTGGPKADDLDGGAGDDQLNGGRGVDRFAGGLGNDSIVSRDGLRETIACGPGTDRVTADLLDVTTDCESVSRG